MRDAGPTGDSRGAAPLAVRVSGQGHAGEARRRGAPARFREIYGEFDAGRAKQQAGRCSQCGMPYCQVHCPLQNNIPDWLMLTAEGRLRRGLRGRRAPPTTCPRSAAASARRIGSARAIASSRTGYGAVTIGSVEKFITDTAFGRRLGRSRRRRGASSASRSASSAPGRPASPPPSSCARKGYEVHVYDRHDRVGGLLDLRHPQLQAGEAGRRAPRTSCWRRAASSSTSISRSAATPRLEELRQRHDAMLIATGVYKARDMACPGVGLGGVVAALDYLIASNRKGLGDAVPAFDSGALDAAGKNVVVIGGGDTAMDCVRTAVRQGAHSVRCLYRRDRANMPGSQREVRHAEEEGVEFVWLAAPEALRSARARCASVRAHRMRLGVARCERPPARREPIAGSAFRARRRSRDQGARLRSRGSADAVRRARARR